MDEEDITAFESYSGSAMSMEDLADISARTQQALPRSAMVPTSLQGEIGRECHMQLTFLRATQENTGTWQGEEPWPFGHDPAESGQERMARWVREYRERDDDDRLGPVERIDMSQPYPSYRSDYQAPNDIEMSDTSSDPDDPREYSMAHFRPNSYDIEVEEPLDNDSLPRSMRRRFRRQLRRRFDVRSEEYRLHLEHYNEDRADEDANWRLDLLRRKQLKAYLKAGQKLEKVQLRYNAILANYLNEYTIFQNSGSTVFAAINKHAYNVFECSMHVPTLLSMLSWFPADRLPRAFWTALNVLIHTEYALEDRKYEKALAHAELHDLVPVFGDPEAQMRASASRFGRFGYEIAPPARLSRISYAVFRAPVSNDIHENIAAIYAAMKVRFVRLQQADAELAKASESYVPHASHYTANVCVAAWLVDAEEYVLAKQEQSEEYRERAQVLRMEIRAWLFELSERITPEGLGEFFVGHRR